MNHTVVLTDEQHKYLRDLLAAAHTQARQRVMNTNYVSERVDRFDREHVVFVQGVLSKIAHATITLN